MGNLVEVFSHEPEINKGRLFFVYSENGLYLKTAEELKEDLRDVSRRRLINIAHLGTKQTAYKVVRRYRSAVRTAEYSPLLLHEHLFGLEGYDDGGYDGHLRFFTDNEGVAVVFYHNLTMPEFELIVEALHLMEWRILASDSPEPVANEKN